ncbi:MAG: hypothetical protein ACRYE9_01735 [Janthinobacterium lividum]
MGCDEAIGRSKGGLSTKIQAICDALGNPTALHLTAGQRHELVGADALMTKLTLSKAVIADTSV